MNNRQNKTKQTLLADFEVHRPRFETSQKDTLEWLIAAHTKAEEKQSGHDWNEEKRRAFEEKFREKIWHVGCKPDKISKRGHSIEDYLHQDWSKMRVYPLDRFPAGADLGTRLQAYGEIAEGVFEHYYENEESPPKDLIHVTCTGYIAPSGAQKIVARKSWGDSTTVTHAYHMGCYGAISALRMAGGFLSGYGMGNDRTDIVHTEICSLHTNPSLHSADQLIAQSLFADGFIKYSAYPESPQNSPFLQVNSVHEKLIPNSEDAMNWNLADWGFQISLAKEIPVLIARSLQDYLAHLCKKGGKDPDEIRAKAHFAIHPGGPKILQHIQDFFRLKNEQIEKSQTILQNYGNMSSATLPHIWDSIVKDDAIPKGAQVVSMAFGPGLSICGALLEKG